MNSEAFSRSEEQLDYPPAYPNGSLHLGHLYESFLYYSYYRLSDYETRENNSSAATKKFLRQIFKHKLELQKNVRLHLGYDVNGLPLTLLARKNFPSEKNCFPRCEELALKNSRTMNEMYTKVGLTELRQVDHYMTNDTKFKTLFETFFEKVKPYLSSTRRPHLYCPSCKTFLARTETSEVEKSAKTYYFSVQDAHRTGVQHRVMTKRPELTLGCILLAKHPDDLRYHNLTEARLKINNKFKTIPVRDSKMINPQVGTGLMFVSAWGGEIDYKILTELGLSVESSLHNDDGTLKNELLTQYNLQSWAEVSSSLFKAETSDTRTTIRELCHTERSSCNQPVIYMNSRQIVLKLTVDLRTRLRKKIQQLRCSTETRNKLLNQLENFRDWCISRSKTYYSFAAEFEGVEFNVDTWFISCLTTLLGSKVIRCQGSDIVGTWAFYSLLAEVLSDTNKIQRLIVHNMIVDPHGQKLSKSKNNAPNVIQLLEGHNLASIRHYFCEKPMDRPIRFNEKEIVDISRYFRKVQNIEYKLDLLMKQQLATDSDSKSSFNAEKSLQSEISFCTEDSQMLVALKTFYTEDLLNFDFHVLYKIRAWIYKLSRRLNEFIKSQDLSAIRFLFDVCRDVLKAFS